MGYILVLVRHMWGKDEAFALVNYAGKFKKVQAGYVRERRSFQVLGVFGYLHFCNIFSILFVIPIMEDTTRDRGYKPGQTLRAPHRG